MNLSSDFEFLVLTTDVGRALLDEVASLSRPMPADLARWRKLAASDWVSAASRLVEARRKGAKKFDRADRMWLDPVGIEQATSERVARHKAIRFGQAEPSGLVVDLCSGIGGDSLSLASQSARVIAVDVDPSMGRRALWNTGVYEVGDRVMAVQSRAEAFAIPAGARVHVDPDRRAARRGRARKVVDYEPGLAWLLGLAAQQVGGALKLSPASDFEAHFGGPRFEVELISLNGECKEATIWFGDLKSPGVRRRATSLSTGATWTDQDGARSALAASSSVEAWTFDPDPCLIRSGLIDGFAAAHGLRRIVPGVDLLTGPDRVDSPFLAPFEVEASFPLDLKILRREVAARGLGTLEIKTRGLQTTPEAYRTQLRPEGPGSATLILIAGSGQPGRAILARRWGGGRSDA